jgi:hypothetical protein
MGERPVLAMANGLMQTAHAPDPHALTPIAGEGAPTVKFCRNRGED